MKSKHLSGLETFHFVFLLLAGMVPLFTAKWFPTMDGPAHIYSANLVKELFQGNAEVQEFFRLHLLVPNATGSLLLALFRWIFPAWLAEKMLVMLIIVLLPLGFRYLVYSIRRKPTLLTLLIFPFVWHFLFMIGFYNYSLGMALVLFTLGYYIRTRKQNDWKSRIFLLMLITLLAFTHAFVFFVFCLVWFVIIAGEILQPVLVGKTPLSPGSLVKKYWPFAVTVLPGILLVLISLFGRPEGAGIPGANRYLSLTEHLRWLFITRPLVVYYMDRESVYGIMVFAALLLLVAGALAFTRRGKKEKKNNVNFRLYILISALLLLLLYFVLPDFKAGVGGHLSLRMLIPFYIFLLLWLALRKIPLALQGISLALVLFSGVMLGSIRTLEQRRMSLEAGSLVQAGKRMPAHAVILPINAGDHWLQGHFLNYPGAETPLMILENTVASGGGIIRWARPEPDLSKRYGGTLMFEDTALFSDPFVKKKVDAVVVWKADSRDPRWPKFSEYLLQDFVPYDTMCAGYGWIYVHRKYVTSDSTLHRWPKPIAPGSVKIFSISQPLAGKNEFFEFARRPMIPGISKDLKWLRIEVIFRCDSVASGDSVYLTCMIERKGKGIDYVAEAIHPDSIPGYYRMDYHPPFMTGKDEVLKLYLWNPSRRNLTITDARGILCQGK